MNSSTPNAQSEVAGFNLLSSRVQTYQEAVNYVKENFMCDSGEGYADMIKGHSKVDLVFLVTKLTGVVPRGQFSMAQLIGMAVDAVQNVNYDERY